MQSLPLLHCDCRDFPLIFRDEAFQKEEKKKTARPANRGRKPTLLREAGSQGKSPIPVASLIIGLHNIGKFPAPLPHAIIRDRSKTQQEKRNKQIKINQK
jgi:hypothetical protein